MTITASQIREMATHSAVEVVLTDGRSCVVQAPEHVGGSASGDQLVLPFGGALVLVEADDVASVRVAVPDPDVESLRRGEIPSWLIDRMKDRPELFVKVGRLDPEELARVLGRTEGELGR
jgi:hypothetical protein